MYIAVYEHMYIYIYICIHIYSYTGEHRTIEPRNRRNTSLVCINSINHLRAWGEAYSNIEWLLLLLLLILLLSLLLLLLLLLLLRLLLLLLLVVVVVVVCTLVCPAPESTPTEHTEDTCLPRRNITSAFMVFQTIPRTDYRIYIYIYIFQILWYMITNTAYGARGRHVPILYVIHCADWSVHTV